LYNLIIFHKSGILLFSYDFDTDTEFDESLLKGSILIGLNHILANFLSQKDQLNLIKLKTRDLILEYDNKLGYAILLITNQKNKIIERAVKLFMDKFTTLNKQKLENLNGLIDVSEFQNAKDIMFEFFKPFLK